MPTAGKGPHRGSCLNGLLIFPASLHHSALHSLCSYCPILSVPHCNFSLYSCPVFALFVSTHPLLPPSFHLVNLSSPPRSVYGVSHFLCVPTGSPSLCVSAVCPLVCFLIQTQAHEGKTISDLALPPWCPMSDLAQVPCNICYYPVWNILVRL